MDVIKKSMQSIPKEVEKGAETEDSPLLEEAEVVHLLGVTAKELQAARKQRAIRAEPYRHVWCQLRPTWRYRLKALEGFVQKTIRDSREEYRMPGEHVFDEMVARALRTGASDVHIQPDRRGVHLRFRVGGMLHTREIVPPRDARYLFSYLALMSGHDPRGQNTAHGCVCTTAQPREHWVRFTSIRSYYGMTTTLRILPTAAPTEWSELGMTDEAQQADVAQLLESPHPGLTLFAMPQSEGLTTTLRCALYQTNRPENNIQFWDDIADFPTGAITRVVYDPESGITPMAAVQIAQRQDASLLVFGEITDAETALAAITAAESGMQVWAGVRVPRFTMNAVPEESAAIVSLRFRKWGIGEERLKRSLRGVVMQRLVRCLCPDCKTPLPLTDIQELQLQSYGIMIPETVYKAAGCDLCHRTGYRARTGVFSVHVPKPWGRQRIAFAVGATRLLAAGETDIAELKRLEAWGAGWGAYSLYR